MAQTHTSVGFRVALTSSVFAREPLPMVKSSKNWLFVRWETLLVLVFAVWPPASSPSSPVIATPRPQTPRIDRGPRTGQLVVTVLDPDGSPLGGASVALHRPSEPTALRTGTTHENGVVSLREVPEGRAWVTVTRASFAREVVAAHVVSPASQLTVRVRTRAKLTGLVMDEKAEVVANARVRAAPDLELPSDFPGWTSKTNHRGMFAIDTLAKGAYQVEVSAPGFENSVRRGVPAGNGETIRFVIRRTGGIDGQVRDIHGAPAKDAEVVIAGSGIWPPRTVTTNEAGVFALTGVPGGVYEIRAMKGTLVSEPREGLSLEPGGRAHLELKLVEGVSVGGTVVDARTRSPIAGAEIVLAESALAFAPRAVRSGAGGTFAIAGLLPKAHHLVVRASDYVVVEQEVIAGRQPSVDVALHRASTIRGVVVDALGKPVPSASIEVEGHTEKGDPILVQSEALSFQESLFDAQAHGPRAVRPGGDLGVTLGAVPPIPSSPMPGAEGLASLAEGSDRGLRTDANGQFTVHGLPPGKVRVRVVHPAFGPGFSDEVTLDEGVDLVSGLRIVLPEAGSLEGRVVDARGIAVPFVRVELQAEHERSPRSALGDDQGRFRFDGVLGAVTLSALPFDMAPVSASLEIRAKERKEITLRLGAEARSLSGRVVDARGFPVEDARVSVRKSDEKRGVVRTAVSAVDGRFAVSALPDPPYDVRVEHSAYADTHLPRVSSNEELKITLVPGASVLGRVVDDWDGKGVHGARVTLSAASGPAAEARSTRSDMEGKFEFRRVKTGNYVVILDDNEHVSLRGHVAVGTDARLERVSVPDLRMLPAGTVEGQVVDALGDAVPRAYVVAGSGSTKRETQTDDAGRFALTGMAPGKVSLTAEDAAAGNATITVRVFPRERASDLRLRLPRRLPLR